VRLKIDFRKEVTLGVMDAIIAASREESTKEMTTPGNQGKIFGQECPVIRIEVGVIVK